MMSPFQTLPTLPSHGGLLGIEPDQLDHNDAGEISDRTRQSRGLHPPGPCVSSVNSAQCPSQRRDDRILGTLRDLRGVQFVYTGAYTDFASAEREGSARHSDGVTETTASVDKQLLGKSTKGNVKNGSESTTLFGLGTIDKNDPFKLPYSLLSYERAVTDPVSGLFRGSKRKFSATTCDCGPSQKKRDFVSAFIARHCDTWEAKWQIGSTPTTMSFQHVFLGYARVWVFADRFAITSLMDLAFSKLAYRLAQWTISESAFVPEFGGLVRYVYGNSAAGSQLRRLVAEFAACVVEDVSSLEGWPVLLEDMPAFAADLVRQMMERFS
ncbi:hypothetical protein GQ53DRAFT_842496 [Thozetella sp. PMI_491]|nr:hypothetical protein GQ53DRAFT_842496 [Thozetella sp. PMI_491]